MGQEMNRCDMRDHLFLSYATEDWPLAEWLTRRLTAEGYRVWCDRFKLLGGESYPKDIDMALEHETFRVLALLSRSSLHKDNPRRERTKALNLARSLGIPDFLIPLNVDGLRPSELPWMTSDITFIPFSDGWAKGFQQLLKKLVSINTPRLLSDGQRIAIETFFPSDVLTNTPELLFGNCLPFLRIPNELLRFIIDPPLLRDESSALTLGWPHYFVSGHEVIAFHSPPASVLELGRVSGTERIRWQETFEISDIRTQNIILSLLKKALRHRAVARGLLPTPDGRVLYLPLSVANGDRLEFDLPYGGSTYIRYTGERTYWRLGERRPYRYYLAVSFRVRRDLQAGYVAQLIPAFYFTDPSGTPLPARTAASRRKHLTRDWWNYEWFNRHLALAHLLADGTEVIRIAGADNDTIELSARFLTFTAPVGINEAALGLTREEVETAQVSQEDDSGDDFDEDGDE